MQLVLQSIRASKSIQTCSAAPVPFSLLGDLASSRWDSGSVSHCRVGRASLQPRSRRRPQWLLRRCPGRGPPSRWPQTAGARRGSRQSQAERRAASPPPPPPPRTDRGFGSQERESGGEIGRSAVTPSGRNHARAAHERSGTSTAERTADGGVGEVTGVCV